jgi:hypothetical protein
MFNIHRLRRAWATGEEVRALKTLIEENGDKPLEGLASELGISVATLSDRVAVLKMGPGVLRDLEQGKVKYSTALRVQEVARTLGRRRPVLVKRLGGEKSVERKLLEKAKTRGKNKGISQELVEARKDLADPRSVNDATVERYISEPAITMSDLRRKVPPLGARRKTDDLNKDLRRIEKAIRSFDADLKSVPDLKELRVNLDRLMEAAQDLEQRVVQAMIKNRGETNGR